MERVRIVVRGPRGFLVAEIDFAPCICYTNFVKKITSRELWEITTLQALTQDSGPEAAFADRWQEAWHIRAQHFSPQIGFVRPSRTLSVSLTGFHCALGCAHCGGHYLNGMVPIEDADATGMTSCLISGGCDAQGKVPVGSHMSLVKALRSGRVLNWHVGLIGEDEMCAIAPYVDIISFDFVGDDATIHEVYGLNCTVGHYVSTYRMLQRHAVVVPHLILGLRGGQLRGEYRALHLLAEIGLPALVVLVLIPTPGTRYADCEPPPLTEVADFLLTARCALPDTPIHLGCMRPGGRYRRDLDLMAVWAGVNKIVNPAPIAVQLAGELGLKVKRESECCVIQRS